VTQRHALSDQDQTYLQTFGLEVSLDAVHFW